MDAVCSDPHTVPKLAQKFKKKTCQTTNDLNLPRWTKCPWRGPNRQNDGPRRFNIWLWGQNRDRMDSQTWSLQTKARVPGCEASKQLPPASNQSSKPTLHGSSSNPLRRLLGLRPGRIPRSEHHGTARATVPSRAKEAVRLLTEVFPKKGSGPDLSPV